MLFEGIEEMLVGDFGVGEIGEVILVVDRCVSGEFGRVGCEGCGEGCGGVFFVGEFECCEVGGDGVVVEVWLDVVLMDGICLVVLEVVVDECDVGVGGYFFDEGVSVGFVEGGGEIGCFVLVVGEVFDGGVDVSEFVGEGVGEVVDGGLSGDVEVDVFVFVKVGLED